MAQPYYGILTDIGIAAFANAAVMGQKINFSQMVVGDGGGAYYQPSSDMTQLRNTVWTGAMASVQIDPNNANQIQLNAVLPSNVGGFTIRELGALDAAGRLIAVANTPDLQKVVLEDGVSSEFNVAFEVAVSNSQVVEFTVDPTVIIATRKDIENHANSAGLHTTTALQNYWNGKADGDHTHTAADVGADPAGAAATAEANAKAASVPLAQKGVAGGVAELDQSGHVPSNQLPSYVDDVVEGHLVGDRFYEDADGQKEIVGEAGKLYVDLEKNISYRWSGSAFIRVDEGVVLGETSQTAHRGDHGKIAYEHSQDDGQHVTTDLKEKINTAPGPTHNHSGQSSIGEDGELEDVDGSGGLISYNYLTDKPERMTPVTHAETHKTGGTDPITPADIGAISKEEAADLSAGIALQNSNFIGLALEVAILKGAALSGVNANIFVENFFNLNDITLTNGVYDQAGRRVYLP